MPKQSWDLQVARMYDECEVNCVEKPVPRSQCDAHDQEQIYGSP